MNKVKVLVADEHTLVREGICSLLKACKAMEIVGEATDGKETIEMVREHAPDVLLMNITMPIIDGAEVTYQIRKESSDIKVLLLTQYEDKEHVLMGLKAGASGYIHKKATASDLVKAILAVYQGGCFLYPSVAKTVVDDYFQLIRQPAPPDSYDKLTHRERQVLKLMAEGRKSTEIANILDIAVKTTLGHRTSMMRKLSIHNRTELIKYAIRKHLVTVDG
jgi:DNA-binding NarL/FixJ family response regulator